MTTTTMAFPELAEKRADIEVLRPMVKFIAQRLMELDVKRALPRRMQ
jgi:putative transposase